MAIDFRWWAMSGPPGMGDGDLGDESLVYVEGRSGDFLAEASDFAYFLEEDNRSWLIAINAKTGGIVASVLLTSETSAENFENLFATLKIRVSINEHPVTRSSISGELAILWSDAAQRLRP